MSTSPSNVQSVDSSLRLDRSQIEAAVALLRQGGLVAFPTETVYGLGADAESPAALDRLYTVKGRPKGHPVIVHLASYEQLENWAVEIPKAAWKLAHAFWPGPLTLVLKRSARVLNAVTGGQDTVGLRVPAHPVALQLLKAFGGGIAAPSANRFGRLSPTRAEHVRADLGDDVSMILDGGDCQVGVESTIVAFPEGQPVILRPGMISAEQIEAVLQSDSLESSSGMQAESRASDHIESRTAPAPGKTSVIHAPGTLASHYAPRTPLLLVSSDDLNEKLTVAEGSRIGVLALQFLPQALAEQRGLVWKVMPADPEEYARQLYAALREMDGQSLQQIWVEEVPNDGAWVAVADRLKRAAYQG